MTIVGLFSILTFVQLLHRATTKFFLTLSHREKKKAKIPFPDPIPNPDPSPNPNCNTTPWSFDYTALLMTAVQIRYF